MALAFSVIAALVVFLTGLFTDARIGTAFLRSSIAFVCAGAFTYLVTFILEAKGWTAYDKMPDERMEDMKKIVYDADDIDFDAEDDGAEDAIAFAEPKDFRPLSAETLTHMTSPDEAHELPVDEMSADEEPTAAAPA